jgi:hypothetical protein
VIADNPDHPVIAVTSGHEPAFAADELRHRSSSYPRPSVVPRYWRDLGVFRARLAHPDLRAARDRAR